MPPPRKLMTALIVLTLAALALPGPAHAQYYYDRYHHRHYRPPPRRHHYYRHDDRRPYLPPR